MVSGERVQANSFHCTICIKWIHKRCIGVRDDLSLVANGIRCKRCDGTIQETDLSGDLVGMERHGCVKRCCYLGDTLDGATSSIRNGWMKFGSFFLL